PRYLTAIMSRPVSAASGTYGGAEAGECRALTNAIYPGLDVTREIQSVEAHALGASVAVSDAAGAVQAFAVCHCGAGTEAGEGVCYVKFAAAQDEPSFDRLLDCCLGLAAERGLTRLVAGVNTAREGAYRRLVARGFRLDGTGIAMHRPNVPGFSRPDAYIIDDWR
ncbi:MAG: GNAT family N-acetyltransferase, partial [Chloroflexi bacterium]|nr:GNAT family N-acetyltransferase [Chloroflexota bacterium]